MAHISVVAALLVGISYVVFQLLNRVVQSRRRAAKALELGCKEPPMETNRLPFGIDKVMEAMKAEKAKLFLEWIQERHDAMRSSTCKLDMGASRLSASHVPSDDRIFLIIRSRLFQC